MQGEENSPTLPVVGQRDGIPLDAEERLKGSLEKFTPLLVLPDGVRGRAGQETGVFGEGLEQPPLDRGFGILLACHTHLRIAEDAPLAQDLDRNGVSVSEPDLYI